MPISKSLGERFLQSGGNLYKSGTYPYQEGGDLYKSGTDPYQEGGRKK